VVVLVEGRSDVAAVEALCAARGLDPETDSFALVDMGGVTNVAHHLTRLTSSPGSPRVLGLCDAPEERFVIRALRREGVEVETRQDLERAGFVVCDRDLEDELIRALGVEGVERVIGAQGELPSLRRLQAQPAQRGRSSIQHLRRFISTRSGRKAQYARALVLALDLDCMPRPLDAVLGW